MSDEFTVHRLNKAGLQLADEVATKFAALLNDLESVVPAGRERALVVTKLQEACFFAKRAIAVQSKYQDSISDVCRWTLGSVSGQTCPHGYTWQCPVAVGERSLVAHEARRERE